MTDEQIREGLAVARQCLCATACVKPCSVALARDTLAGSGVGVCAVIGFPHSNSTTGIKVVEAEQATLAGAGEIDMVVNAGKAIGGDWAYVSREIHLINEAVVGSGGILKVIFENDFLTDEQIVELCRICSERRVAFAKTSTGFGFVKQTSGDYNYKGATEHHVKLMRKHLSPHVQIKAAGGIKTLDDLLRFRALGATRIGASATLAILDEARRRFGETQPGDSQSNEGRKAAAASGY